jgi:hypothetical protein
VLFVLQCLGGYRIASHRIASHRIHNLASMHKLAPIASVDCIHACIHASCTKTPTRTSPVFPSPRPRPRPPSKHQWRAQKPQPKAPSGLPSRRRRLPSSRTLVRVRTARTADSRQQTAQTAQCNAMPLCCHVLTSAPSTIDIIRYTIRQVQYACVASEQTRTHALTPFRGMPSWLVRLTANDRRPTTDD